MKLVNSPIVIAPLRTRYAPATSRKMLTTFGTPSSSASNVLRNLIAPNRALRNRDPVEALVHRFAELAELGLRVVVEAVDPALVCHVQRDQQREHRDRRQAQ